MQSSSGKGSESLLCNVFILGRLDDLEVPVCDMVDDSMEL